MGFRIGGQGGVELLVLALAVGVLVGCSDSGGEGDGGDSAVEPILAVAGKRDAEVEAGAPSDVDADEDVDAGAPDARGARWCVARHTHGCFGLRRHRQCDRAAF